MPAAAIPRMVSMHTLYSPHIRARGVACKAIFDCTVPFDQKERFTRAKFMNINMEKWKDVM